MATKTREEDPRLSQLDIAMPPVPPETAAVIENAAAQFHTQIVIGVYGPEEVEEDTGSVRR